MATITNTQVGTAAALVPAPYGPLTRVTDMGTLPVPNDMQQIHLTDANSNAVYMTYNELASLAEADKVLSLAYGKHAQLHALIIQVGVANTAIQALKNTDGKGYTDAERTTIINLLRDIHEISGFL